MNDMAVAAATNRQLRENFIRDNEQTILRIASKVSGKYITRSDDEWSVALLAFNKAIDTYSPDRGDFGGYAAVLIKRALVLALRHEKITFDKIIITASSRTGYRKHPFQALLRQRVKYILFLIMRKGQNKPCRYIFHAGLCFLRRKQSYQH